ncbi:MAG: hypothetical protein DRO88_13665 [Promethearchaeia archaeon]|nr:MAG: hypothetical protein DRO88_13665 [Candidatus Lokiarchaeia archaeon]
MTSSFNSQKQFWKSDLTQRNDKFFSDMIGQTGSHKKDIVLQSPLGSACKEQVGGNYYFVGTLFNCFGVLNAPKSLLVMDS